MNVKRVVVAFFIYFVCINIASAAFSVDWNASSVKKSYTVGDTLSGTIVISFQNESIDSEIYSNVGSGKTSLRQWLSNSGKREKFDYNCSFSNCASRYQANKEISELTVFVDQPKIFGFKASGSNISVTSLSLTAKSNLQASCTKQFSIDVLSAQKYAFENYQYTSEMCSENRKGCFDSTLSESQYQLANIAGNGFCERIRLDPAPAYVLGANLLETTTQNEEIIMQLYDSAFNTFYGECSFSSTSGNSSCIMPYPISEEGEYAVCVQSNQTNSAYQIRTEFVGSICGTSNFGQSITRDFDIFARGLQYSSEPVVFNGDTFALLNNEQDLNKTVNDYLQSEYGGDCVMQDCFVPFTVIGASQKISFSNASITYQSDGVPIFESSLYEIDKRPSAVMSGRVSLSLDSANLNVSQKNSILQVNLGNKTLFRTNINVSTVPVAIEPTFALIGIPTQFRIKTNESVASAIWKFSDSQTIQTGLNVTHIFSQGATYTIDVTITTNDGRSYTKSQQVSVGEPKASAEELLSFSRQSIALLSGEIKKMPTWIATSTEERINVIALNNSLSAIEEKLNYAANDSEYIQIIDEIRSLNIPEDLGITKTGQYPIIYTYSNANLGYLASLYQIEQDPETYRQPLIEWTRDNYDGTIEVTTYSTRMTDGSQEALLTKVKIDLSKKGGASEEYLVIDYPIEAIKFLSGYSEKELQGATYIPLQDTNEIEFYIEEDLSAENLGIYILPALRELEEGGYNYELVQSPSDGKGVMYISLTILALIFVATVVSIQYWYRNRYEKYLFKDEESLFNVMTFIYNAKGKGLKEGDIRKKLLGSGWRREQINYALGRFEGKVFGLFGIPIYSARQEAKVRSSIEMRQKQNTSRKVY